MDGVLLYLSKSWDVLSMAVSGENKMALFISHFLQLKGKKQAIQKFGDKLRPVLDDLNGYWKSPEKFKPDDLTPFP